MCTVDDLLLIRAVILPPWITMHTTQHSKANGSSWCLLSDLKTPRKDNIILITSLFTIVMMMMMMMMMMMTTIVITIIC
jgi:hypothetical protein